MHLCVGISTENIKQRPNVFIKVNICIAFSQVAVANMNPISGKSTLNQFTLPLRMVIFYIFLIVSKSYEMTKIENELNVITDIT